MKPSYATAVIGNREVEVIEGILEEPAASTCCSSCEAIRGLEDVLPGSAGKGAAVGATVGSFIPGVGTAVGGAVGAAASAVADLLGGGGSHCKIDGREVPCPNCGMNLQCMKDWVAQKVKEKAQQQRAAAGGPSTWQGVMPSHLARPTPTRARLRAPPPPPPARRPLRVETPRAEPPRAVAESSSGVPLAIGAAALLAAGGGAWWWLKQSKKGGRR